MNQQRVLIVRLGSMGDIVHSLPALAALKQTFPAWEVDWLVERRWRPLLDGIPLLSRVEEIDTLEWRSQPLSPAAWSKVRGAVRSLRERRYDLALDLQASLKSATACYLSGAREVVGFDGPWLKEPSCAIFYSRRIATDAVHIADANLALATALGARQGQAQFPLPPGDPSLLPKDLPPDGFAVVNPGAGWAAKCWPAENYAVVCDCLQTEWRLPVVLNCGPGEEELVQQVSRACRHSAPTIYTGEVAGLIALLRQRRLMLGPDTGPVHLAAALGTPTVGLFGPTDPKRNGPYGARVRTLRAGNAVTSYRHSLAAADAMRQMQPDHVLSAIREILERERNSPEQSLLCADRAAQTALC